MWEKASLRSVLGSLDTDDDEKGRGWADIAAGKAEPSPPATKLDTAKHWLRSAVDSFDKLEDTASDFVGEKVGAGLGWAVDKVASADDQPVISAMDAFKGKAAPPAAPSENAERLKSTLKPGLSSVYGAMKFATAPLATIASDIISGDTTEKFEGLTGKLRNIPEMLEEMDRQTTRIPKQKANTGGPLGRFMAQTVIQGVEQIDPDIPDRDYVREARDDDPVIPGTPVTKRRSRQVTGDPLLDEGVHVESPSFFEEPVANIKIPYGALHALDQMTSSPAAKEAVEWATIGVDQPPKKEYDPAKSVASIPMDLIGIPAMAPMLASWLFRKTNPKDDVNAIRQVVKEGARDLVEPLVDTTTAAEKSLLNTVAVPTGLVGGPIAKGRKTLNVSRNINKTAEQIDADLFRLKDEQRSLDAQLGEAVVGERAARTKELPKSLVEAIEQLDVDITKATKGSGDQFASDSILKALHRKRRELQAKAAELSDPGKWTAEKVDEIATRLEEVDAQLEAAKADYDLVSELDFAAALGSGLALQAPRLIRRAARRRLLEAKTGRFMNADSKRWYGLTPEDRFRPEVQAANRATSAAEHRLLNEMEEIIEVIPQEHRPAVYDVMNMEADWTLKPVQRGPDGKTLRGQDGKPLPREAALDYDEAKGEYFIKPGVKLDADQMRVLEERLPMLNEYAVPLRQFVDRRTADAIDLGLFYDPEALNRHYFPQAYKDAAKALKKADPSRFDMLNRRAANRFQESPEADRFVHRKLDASWEAKKAIGLYPTLEAQARIGLGGLIRDIGRMQMFRTLKEHGPDWAVAVSPEAHAAMRPEARERFAKLQPRELLPAEVLEVVGERKVEVRAARKGARDTRRAIAKEAREAKAAQARYEKANRAYEEAAAALGIKSLEQARKLQEAYDKNAAELADLQPKRAAQDDLDARYESLFEERDKLKETTAKDLQGGIKDLRDKANKAARKLKAAENLAPRVKTLRKRLDGAKKTLAAQEKKLASANSRTHKSAERAVKIAKEAYERAREKSNPADGELAVLAKNVESAENALVAAKAKQTRDIKSMTEVVTKARKKADDLKREVDQAIKLRDKADLSMLRARRDAADKRLAKAQEGLKEHRAKLSDVEDRIKELRKEGKYDATGVASKLSRARAAHGKISGDLSAANKFRDEARSALAGDVVETDAKAIERLKRLDQERVNAAAELERFKDVDGRISAGQKAIEAYESVRDPLPTPKRHGELSGMYVDRDLMKEWDMSERIAESMKGVLGRLNRMMKVNKTAYSVTTTMRNLWTNVFLFAAMAETPEGRSMALTDARNMDDYVATIDDMAAPRAKKSHYFMEAAEDSVFGGTVMRTEVGDQNRAPMGGAGSILSDVPHVPAMAPMKKAFKNPQTAMTTWVEGLGDLMTNKARTAIGQTAKRLGQGLKDVFIDGPKKLYGSLDDVFRATYYRVLRKEAEAKYAPDMKATIAAYRAGQIQRQPIRRRDATGREVVHEGQQAERFVDRRGVALPEPQQAHLRQWYSDRMDSATKARQAFIDYENVAGWAQVLRAPVGNFGGLYSLAAQPFIAFPSRAIPLMFRWLERNPIRATMYANMFEQMTWHNMESALRDMGMSEDEIAQFIAREQGLRPNEGSFGIARKVPMAAFSPDLAFEGEDNEGNLKVNAMDAAHLSPLAFLVPNYDGTQSFGANMSDYALSFIKNNPVVGTVHEIAANRDTFSGNQLHAEGADLPGRLVGYGSHITRKLLPPGAPSLTDLVDYGGHLGGVGDSPFEKPTESTETLTMKAGLPRGPGGTEWENLVAGARGARDFVGNKRTVEQAKQRMFTGINQSYSTQRERMVAPIRNLMFRFPELKKDAMKTLSATSPELKANVWMAAKVQVMEGDRVMPNVRRVLDRLESARGVDPAVDAYLDAARVGVDWYMEEDDPIVKASYWGSVKKSLAAAAGVEMESRVFEAMEE